MALERVAEPGDTLVVFGGRADLQLESGLASPYPYLWSLPMRALDPDLSRFRTMVAGPDAPTWLVEWWPFDTWTATGKEPRRRRARSGTSSTAPACGGRTIWLRKDVASAHPAWPACHG